jgi:glutamate-1-semialdehyde 2,1-aminomutase
MTYSDRLNRLIPGGAHTYSRGDDQYPSNAPQILSHGKGAYVWDADGKRFLDYGMALRAVTVGYAYDPITQAALAEAEKGNQLTRPSVTELNAAGLICDLIPCAEMVKFAKNGSTVTTAAVKLARAYTGRKFIAICAQHAFFSYDDWFISSTPMTRGIPNDEGALALKFNYDDITSLEFLFEAHPEEIACVILEPATTEGPCPEACSDLHRDRPCNDCTNKSQNFLHKVRDLCHRRGAVFILDEMITGFRWHLKGAQRYFGIEPDLATFGKGMANGYSVAALVGRRDVMDIGGIRNSGAERVFLISTTHGAEMNGLGAFIKTMEVYSSLDVISHLWRYGRSLMDAMNTIAEDLGIRECFHVIGYPCSPSFITRDRSGAISLAFRTLFLQEMISNGVLMPWIALSYSHQEPELSMTLEAVHRSLITYRKALDEGVGKFLVGPVIKPVFRKYN